MGISSSVRFKLLSVVAVLSVVAAVLTLIGWNRMASMNARLEQIVNNTAPSRAASALSMTSLTRVHRAEKNLILATDPAETEAFAADIEANQAALFERVGRLETVGSAQMVEQAKQFRDDYQAFRGVVDQVVDLARRDTEGEAGRLSASTSRDLISQAVDIVTSIQDGRQAELNEEIANLQQQGKADAARMARAAEAVGLASTVGIELRVLLRDERSVLFSPDPTVRAAAADRIRQARQTIDRAMPELAAVAGASRQADMDALRARVASWSEVHDRIMALAAEGTTAKAIKMSNTEGERLFEQAESRMRAIMEMATADMDEAREKAASEYKSAVTTMVISASVGIIAASAFALLIIGKIVGTLQAVVERMRHVAAGNLVGDPIPVTTKDELGRLAGATNEMQSSLREIVSAIASNSEQVSAAATEVAATSEQMAASSDQQRAQLTQVAAAIEEMAATVTEVSGRTGEVSRQSTEAGSQASEGGDIVRRTVAEMAEIASQVESTATAVGQLSEKAVQIGEILTVINDIADQTNLLALNAAIEAARAGEHGRGFAVVADEVRKLAERTQEATQEVSRSIGEIQSSTGEATEMMGASKSRVSSGVELAQQAGHSLENIVRGSTTVATSIDSIAAAVEEQSATSAEIARSIEVISASANEANQGASQAAAAATQLSGNAEALRELVSRFKV